MSAPRIFCIGRNYAAHVRELGHAEDGECVVFMKPATSLVAADAPLALPRGRGAVHFEAEMTVRIGTSGRDIDEGSAHRHIDAVGLGIDLTLRDLQTTLRERGAPWEACKAFDGSAPLGPWQPCPDGDLQALRFSCTVNGEVRQEGDTSHMLFPVARILRILSETWTLLPGDIVFTGTPAGVGPLVAGDVIALQGDDLGRAEWQCV